LEKAILSVGKKDEMVKAGNELRCRIFDFGFQIQAASTDVQSVTDVARKNPVHPGALAKANLDELNLRVAEAAKTMKITRQQLHNVMQGKGAVTPEMALRFEKAFGGSADMWLRMQAAYDLAQARKHQGTMNIPRLGEHPSL
jgi:antitoxin HigA-1